MCGYPRVLFQLRKAALVYRKTWHSNLFKILAEIQGDCQIHQDFPLLAKTEICQHPNPIERINCTECCPYIEETESISDSFKFYWEYFARCAVDIVARMRCRAVCSSVRLTHMRSSAQADVGTLCTWGSTWSILDTTACAAIILCLNLKCIGRIFQNCLSCTLTC